MAPPYRRKFALSSTVGLTTLIGLPAAKATICSKISVEVAIFRASNRNKRRGIHNLHVYYEHIKSMEGLVPLESQDSLLCH